MSFVLLQAVDRPDMTVDDVKVLGPFDDLDAVRAKIARIAAANPQHPMVETVAGKVWRIGPDGDEGFFGDKARLFHLRQLAPAAAPRGRW